MKWRIIVAILLAALITALSACNTGTNTNTSKNDSAETATAEQQSASGDLPAETGDESKPVLNLHFANDDNSAVLLEKREVAAKDEDIVKAAVEALIEGPSDANLHRTIPEGTKLIESSVAGGTATVNFSKEFLNVNGMAEIVERASLVNTLTDIEGIQKVKILIDGEELIGPSGMPFGELERFELDEQGRPIAGEKRTVTLYFGNADADAVVAEEREAYIIKDEPIEAEIFYELAKGPANKELSPTIPEGTRVLSVETKDGICRLNLSKEFIDNSSGGSAGESMTINSIVNTLTELPGIEKVQFLIEGKVREAYIHLEFSEPFERNEEIIEK